MNRTFIELVTILVILALAVSGYVGLELFVEKSAVRSATAAADVERALKEAEAESESRDILAALAADEADVVSRFLNPADIAVFLEKLEATGRALGSTVDVVTVADKPTAEGRVSLTLQVIGSFDSVLRTIGAIEYGPHDIRVESLTLDTAPDGAGTWTSNAVFTVGVREQTTVSR